MAKLISSPFIIKEGGDRPIIIEEYLGKVNSNDESVSIARLKSVEGWIEPAQAPEFDEYTIVLKGKLRITANGKVYDVSEGQAIHVLKGERIQYSSPEPGGAEYIAVCIPAFSAETAHRDK